MDLGGGCRDVSSSEAQFWRAMGLNLIWHWELTVEQRGTIDNHRYPYGWLINGGTLFSELQKVPGTCVINIPVSEPELFLTGDGSYPIYPGPNGRIARRMPCWAFGSGSSWQWICDPPRCTEFWFGWVSSRIFVHDMYMICTWYVHDYYMITWWDVRDFWRVFGAHCCVSGAWITCSECVT